MPQEDSQNYIVSSALSVIRWAAVLLALALPAFYTAIAMYHQEMIPTQLLLSVISVQAGRAVFDGAGAYRHAHRL